MNKKVFFLLCSCLVSLSSFAEYKSELKFSKFKGTTVKQIPSQAWGYNASSLDYSVQMGKEYSFLVVDGLVTVKWFENDSTFYFQSNEVYLHGEDGKKIEPIGQINNQGRFTKNKQYGFRRDHSSKKKAHSFNMHRLVFPIADNAKKAFVQLGKKKLKLKVKKGEIKTTFKALGSFTATVDSVSISDVQSGESVYGIDDLKFVNSGKARIGRLVKIDVTIDPKQDFIVAIRDFTLETTEGYLLRPSGCVYRNDSKIFDEDNEFNFESYRGKYKKQVISLIFNIGDKTKTGKLFWFDNKVGDLSFSKK